MSAQPNISERLACVGEEAEEGPNWTIIIAITASVGGAIALAVVVAVIVQIVVVCCKSGQ